MIKTKVLMIAASFLLLISELASVPLASPKGLTDEVKQ